MRVNRIFVRASSLAVLLTAPLLPPNIAFAHCDGMDSPIVKAAQKALETGNVDLILIWVQKQDDTRSFYLQLVFPPPTFNKFQRHPCHEVVALIDSLSSEKAALKNLRNDAQKCGPTTVVRLWSNRGALDSFQ